MSPEMFGRIDDARMQTGAALLQNMISKPNGPASMRPGFEFVREIKDSTNKARLIPFTFTNEQTLVIEMGRATVQSRAIGYFRFHTGGQTLLYTTPAAYVAPQNVTGISVAGDTFTTAAHGLSVGDPVVLTMTASAGVTFSLGPPSKVLLTAADTLLQDGTQVIFDDGSGTLPSGIVAGRIYYAVNVVSNGFNLAAFRNGPVLSFGLGVVGTTMAAMPSGASVVDANRTYYAIDTSTTTFQVALTKADALDGTQIDLTLVGNGGLRMHYAYKPGDRAASGGNNFFCMKRPWGEENAVNVTTANHLDHPTTNTGYWYQLPQSPNILEVPHYYAQDALFDVVTFQSADVLTLLHPSRPASELRRLGAEDWELVEIEPNSSVDAPKDVQITGFSGIGMTVTDMATTVSGEPAGQVLILNNDSANLFVPGEQVQTEDLNAAGTGIPDGFYTVRSTPSGISLTLRNTNTGATITWTPDNANLGAAPRIRNAPILDAWDGSHSYRVTAVDKNGEESEPSEAISATTNLFVTGAFNDITWGEVAGADRYRIYKRQTGLYGFIGEIDAEETLTFRDDNIGPDLSLTPPILDKALRMTAEVTFDGPNDVVVWTDHELVNGTPILFDTDDTLPSDIVLGTTFYVINAGTDKFQVSLTPGGTAVNIGATEAGQGTHTAVAGSFPASGAYFEQRRVFAGPTPFPQDVWLTASGTESDLSFSLPTVDSDRIQFRIAARERGAIRHVIPLGHLILLAASTEYRVTPVNDDALTPASISVRPQSYIGATAVQPSIINHSLVFAAARGGHVRELGFRQDVQSFVTGDLSLRAAHLFDDEEIVQFAYAKAPLPIVWAVSSNGDLLGLTYVPEESVGGWHQHTTDGTFESCAVIAEGEEDRLYVVVKRNVNGADVRYVERMHVQDVQALADVFRVDAGITYDDVATTTIPGLDHLEAETVVALADGVVVTGLTVTGGAVTLTTAASKVHVGLPYTGTLQTLPLVMLVSGFLQGREKNINQVAVRAFESGRFKAGATAANLFPSEAPASGALLTGTFPVMIEGSWNIEGQVVVVQDQPLPLTVSSIALEVVPGG